MTYFIFQITSEAMMDVLEDMHLAEIVRERANEEEIEINIDDL